MEKSRLAVVNALPTKTYRFLKVNEIGIGIPEQATDGGDPWNGMTPPTGVIFSRVERQEELPDEIRAIETGMGASIDRALSDHGIPANILTVAAGAAIEEPVVMPVAVSCGSATMTSLVIRAEAGSSLTLILDMTGSDAGCAAARSFFGLSTRIRAESGAHIRLVHLERFGASITNFDDIGGWCEEGAQIELTTLLLGSRNAVKGSEGSFLGARVTLSGDTSRFVNRTGYYFGGQTSLDMNIVADQRGRETVSDMIFRGVLADHASKTWRGTIDFKSGSAGSVGDEQEDTLMLSPHVRNSSVPVILCAEEDVDGRHGATIGQLSEDMLFYMSSRGIAVEEARRMIVQARLKSIAREIPDSRLRWEIEQWIEKEIA